MQRLSRCVVGMEDVCTMEVLWVSVALEGKGINELS